MRIPAIFKPIITYVTPLFLIIMMVWWTKVEAIPTLQMVGVPEENKPVIIASRLVMVGILILQLVLVRMAWARKARKGVA